MPLGGVFRWCRCPSKDGKPGPALPSPTRTLASGVKVRVFAADPRRVTSTDAKVLYVAELLVRQRLRIEHRVRPIIRSAKTPIIRYTIVRPIVCDELQTVAWPDLILSEHRRGDCSGKNDH